ncbi:MAG TPA: RidA family protein [Polyangiaceae bacterium]|nr:RidA family protein [Polyangiaceae bacterium]
MVNRNSIERINPATLYDGSAFGMSQGAVDSSGLVFLSGQVAWDEQMRVVGSTCAEQVRKALDNLEIALAAAGSDLAHVLHVRVYLRGEVADHLPEIAPIFKARLGASRPALTGLGVASLATPDTLVEIEAVARRIDTSGEP